jgi:hypothetical protein
MPAYASPFSPLVWVVFVMELIVCPCATAPEIAKTTTAPSRKKGCKQFIIISVPAP